MVRRFDPDRPVADRVVWECVAHATRAPSAGFTQGWDFVVLTEAADRSGFWSAASATVISAQRQPSGSTSRCEPPGNPAPATATPWLTGVAAAPVLIVCCSHPDAYLNRYAEPDKGWADRDPARWPIPYWDVDTGMAALLALLTATDRGLGGLFFGVPAARHDAVRAVLEIPADRRLVGVVAIGYALPGPSSPSLRRGRRGTDRVAHSGRFGRPLTAPEPSAAPA